MKDLLAARLPLLEELISDALHTQLLSLAADMTYEDGQLIHARGDAKPGLSIVRSGAVRIGNVGLDGSYLSTSVLDRGQCFGEFTLLAGLPRTHEAVAVGTTVVAQLPRQPFMRLFDQSPELSKGLLKISLLRTHALLEFIDDLRRLPLPVRVAKFLYASAESEDMSIRQEDIAFTFGVSRVSMGKTLQQLQQQGLLELGYGRIRLHLSVLRQWIAEQSLVADLPAAAQ